MSPAQPGQPGIFAIRSRAFSLFPACTLSSFHYKSGKFPATDSALPSQQRTRSGRFARQQRSPYQRAPNSSPARLLRRPTPAIPSNSPPTCAGHGQGRLQKTPMRTHAVPAVGHLRQHLTERGSNHRPPPGSALPMAFQIQPYKKISKFTSRNKSLKDSDCAASPDPKFREKKTARSKLFFHSLKLR